MAAAIELSEGKDLQMDPKDQEIADLRAQVAALLKEKEAKGEGEGAALADLQKKNEELNSKVALMEGEKVEADKVKALAEKTIAFDKLLSEGKVCEAQRAPFIENDAVKLAELSQPVKLADKGNGNDSVVTVATNKDEAIVQIMKLAEEKIKNKTASDLGQAISLVRSENPDLVKLSS